jgi:hypothetical protein
LLPSILDFNYTKLLKIWLIMASDFSIAKYSRKTEGLEITKNNVKNLHYLFCINSSNNAIIIYRKPDL